MWSGHGCGRKTLAADQTDLVELELQLTDELSVLDYGRIKFNSQGLSMIGCPSAHFSVCRVLSFLQPASVSDARLEDALVLRRRILFQEYVFDTPKTPRSECGNLVLSTCINQDSWLNPRIQKNDTCLKTMRHDNETYQLRVTL